MIEEEMREDLRPSPTENIDSAEENGLPPLEIDTMGLIADLMGDTSLEVDEKKTESTEPRSKSRKQRGKKNE